jgi:general secretion pathway protein G
MTAHDSARSGFTLVEMLVVLAILSIVAWAILPLSKMAAQREHEIELRQDLRLMREAIDAYKKLSDEKKIEVKENTEGYPPTLDVLVNGVELEAQGQADTQSKGKKIVKFLRRIPKDPMTDSFDWGLRSYQDPHDSDKWGGENVYDIYTKSQGKALDGTLYKDW